MYNCVDVLKDTFYKFAVALVFQMPVKLKLLPDLSSYHTEVTLSGN